MNHTYQPSGKISLLFWPAAAAMLTVTAVAALLCIFGIQASRATLLDMMIYSAATKCVAHLGVFLCVRGGKVRKPAFARAAGIALALWYWLLLIAFYPPVKAVLEGEKLVWDREWDQVWKEALTQYAHIFFGNGGVAITGKSGNVLFTMPRIACIMLLAILLLAAAGQFGFGFWKQARAPFCEASGKWARETVVNLGCPEEDSFISRLLLGDTAALAELEPLGGRDPDCYFMVSVFAADWDSPIYVSVVKKTKVKKEPRPRSPDRADAKPKRRKKPVYEEEQVAEYLAADRGTGFALLSRSKTETMKKSMR